MPPRARSRTATAPGTLSRAPFFAGLVAAAIVLSSCSGGEPSADPSGRPVPGGELRVSVRDLGTLDPAKATGPGALLAVAQIFDSLTALDPRTGEVRSAAASSWTHSPDGLTWIFRLRPAIFHDGSPVTAADFKFAFDRLTRKATAAEAAFQLQQVAGWREVKVAGTAQQLSGVEARGDDRVVFKLDRPFGELPVALAHPSLAPLPAAHYRRDAAGLADAPIGNGPFRVQEATLERAATLERFDGYAGDAALLDRVTLDVSPAIEEGWRRFLARTADIADVPPSAYAANLAKIGRDGSTPFWAAEYYGPNLARTKFRKPEVRRALSLAVDREAIASTVYGGTKEPATGILPRGVRGYVADACSSCAHDPDRARRLLRAAFPDKPLGVRIDYLNVSPSGDVARAVAASLRVVGVQVSLRAHAPREYLQLLKAGKHDLAQLAWASVVPSPDGFLAEQLRTRSVNNQTGFADSGFDALVDRARAESDEDARLRLYGDAESRALQQMALIPLVFYRNQRAVAPRVRGLVMDGAGIFDAASVWLAQK